jgi:hypothetical protein
VCAATGRAFARAGQTFSFFKDELTVEAGCWPHYQPPVLCLQAFLEMLHMIKDFTL